jgi:chromate transporter
MTHGDLIRYFLRLGALGFGGPIALAGAMRRDLVDERGWFSEEEYREGLALAQLMPGPLAAQLAIYLGWVRFGVRGATSVAVAFVLPSLLMVMVLSALYVRFGGLSWMRGAFYGIGAAVIAIIVRSALKLVKSTLGQDRSLWAFFGMSALVTAWTESELVWLFLACGAIAVVMKTKFRPAAAHMVLPVWWLSGLSGPAPVETIWKILLFFAEAGAFVFGSGLAIVPFLHASVVNQLQWLTEQQFLDAVAVAMITPGPVVITVAFIGYLVAGPLGGLAAAVGVFLPCYLLVIFPAPYFRRIAANLAVKAFVDGVTAAAVGAIAGAAFVLGRRAIVDWTTAAIAVAAYVVLLRVRKAPEPLLILAAGVVGVSLR